jgi:hypothetical protein
VDPLAILRRGPLGNPPFAPVYQRLAKSMGQQRNLAALATVAIIVAIVILPLITASLVQEASGPVRELPLESALLPDEIMENRLAGFRQGLKEVGFVDAENVRVISVGRTIEPIVYRRWLPILSASSPM